MTFLYVIKWVLDKYKCLVHVLLDKLMFGYIGWLYM